MRTLVMRGQEALGFEMGTYWGLEEGGGRKEKSKMTLVMTLREWAALLQWESCHWTAP